ncbi:MAG: hypothetical protein IT379_34170 [Deltaproteobacteria bacterium]|nr:hypothetical protein [Deltaproteobacteria bacterium]
MPRPVPQSSLLVAVLAVLLSAARPARASAPADAPPRLQLPTAAEVYGPPARASRPAWRRHLGMVAGALTATALSSLAVMGALAAREATNFHDCWESEDPSCGSSLGLPIATAALAMTFLVPVGVDLGGDLGGGSGTFSGAFVGTAVGLLASAVPLGLGALATDGYRTNSADTVAIAAGTAAVVQIITGAIVGYELSRVGQPQNP